MLKFLVMAGKWILKVPVLFAHFPGPSIMLVAGIALSAGALASCVTHRLEAGARAELEVQFAQEKASTAELRAQLSEGRVIAIDAAAQLQRAIDLENQRAWRSQLAALVESLDDKAAIARLNRSIEELHRDPAFACRRRPLPQPYLDGLHLPRESPASGTAATGPRSGDR